MANGRGKLSRITQTCGNRLSTRSGHFGKWRGQRDLYTSLPKSIYSILYGSSSMLAGLLSRVADAVMGPALAVAERGFGIASRIVPSATVTILVPSGSLA